MRISKFNIVILFFFLISSARGANVSFEGGTASDRAALTALLNTIDIETNRDSVETFLSDRGYFGAVISQDGSNLSIDFGEKFRLGRIILQNGERDTVQVNDVFDKTDLERNFIEILDKYRDKGYFYANLRPVEYSARDGFIDITAELQPGPLIIVSGIEFEGLQKTDSRHIAHYIDIRKGDTLDTDALDRSYRQLERLDYVSLDSPPEIIPEEGYNRARIVFRFTEKKRIFLEGSGGYIPEGDGYFMWYFNGKLRNIFGQGRYIQLLVDRRDESKSIFRSEYEQPVFLIGRGRAGLRIATRDYRKQFYEFGVSGFYDVDLSESSSLGVSLEWKDVEPEPGTDPSYNIYGVGVRLQSGEVQPIMTQDFQSALDWRITYLSRRYDIGAEPDTLKKSVYNDTRIDLTATISKRLVNSFHGFGRLLVEDIESGEKPLPLSEVILFGGPGTLRGYRNDRFSARRLFVATAEPRLFWDNRSYLFPFIDAAWYESYRSDSTDTPHKTDDFLYGYGVGVNLGSISRRLIVSLAWGEGAAIDEPRLNITVSDQF